MKSMKMDLKTLLKGYGFTDDRIKYIITEPLIKEHLIDKTRRY